MLKSYSHSNTLLLHSNTTVVEHLIHVASRVTGSQNHGTVKRLTSSAFHAHDFMIGINIQTSHTSHKTHLTTTVDDGVAHVLDDARQLVATNVRMSIDENILAGTMLMKDAEDALHRATFATAGVKLPITVSTCPTLAKAIVAIGVNNALARDGGNIEPAVAHILATLQHYRLDAKFNEPQRGKETARPRTHYYCLAVAFDGTIVDGWHQVVGSHGLVDVGTHLEVYHHSPLSRVD